MALTEETSVDRITVLEDGVILHRTATRIFRDGVKISETYSRGSIIPGGDYSGLDKRITDIACVVQTQEVIADFNQKKADRNNDIP